MENIRITNFTFQKRNRRSGYFATAFSTTSSTVFVAFSLEFHRRIKSILWGLEWRQEPRLWECSGNLWWYVSWLWTVSEMGAPQVFCWSRNRNRSLEQIFESSPSLTSAKFEQLEAEPIRLPGNSPKAELLTLRRHAISKYANNLEHPREIFQRPNKRLPVISWTVYSLQKALKKYKFERGELADTYTRFHILRAKTTIFFSLLSALKLFSGCEGAEKVLVSPFKYLPALRSCPRPKWNSQTSPVPVPTDQNEESSKFAKQERNIDVRVEFHQTYARSYIAVFNFSFLAAATIFYFNNSHDTNLKHFNATTLR